MGKRKTYFLQLVMCASQKKSRIGKINKLSRKKIEIHKLSLLTPAPIPTQQTKEKSFLLFSVREDFLFLFIQLFFLEECYQESIGTRPKTTRSYGTFINIPFGARNAIISSDLRGCFAWWMDLLAALMHLWMIFIWCWMCFRGFFRGEIEGVFTFLAWRKFFEALNFFLNVLKGNFAFKNGISDT